MHSEPRTAIVYVDGFNLYKGQLQSRPQNKWLNLESLFDEVLVGYRVLRVHYFTARIKGRMNPEDPDAPNRQDAYIRALRTLPRVSVHDDSLFAIHHGMAREWVDGKEAPPHTYHSVYKVQEKGSDVKLATQLLLDAFDDAASTLVVVSNDSDLARPMEVVQSRFIPRIGVIYPRDQRTSHFAKAGVEWELFLHPAMVSRHQLPELIHTTTGRIVRRPPTWK